MSYHICTPCNDFNIYIIQDALFLNHQVSRPAHYVYVIIDLTLLLCNVGVYFELNGERYDNNSMVNILAIGIGNSALLCKTNKQDCCGTVPNRLGRILLSSWRSGFQSTSLETVFIVIEDTR